MRAAAQAAVTVAAVAVVATAWLLSGERERPEAAREPAVAAPTSQRPGAAVVPAPPVATAAGPKTSSREAPAPLPALAIETYEDSGYARLRDFRGALQAYVDGASDGIPADGGAGAERLLDAVDGLAGDGYLTAPEALSIRLSLLRYLLPEDEYEVVSAALMEDAREQAEAAERAWATREDPNLERYRSEQRRIIAEVEAMEELPEGVRRQDYLRQRLQQARSAIFGTEP